MTGEKVDVERIEEQHKQHVCSNHPDPGICVRCGAFSVWPCDAMVLITEVRGLRVDNGRLTEKVRSLTHERNMLQLDRA